MRSVAVLIPCFNEAVAIADVVAAFRASLPDATIYVYDNNSLDDTIATARAAGAVIRNEPMQGKGNVIRRMFSDIEADVYVLVDGDGTYWAASAPLMVDLLVERHLDMVVGARVKPAGGAYRLGHEFGNQLFNRVTARLFGQRFTDMLSGYRVFSKRFVKSFPALSTGFETEAELTVHALELRLPTAEMATPYHARTAGSYSKLRTWSDGFRILRMIATLYKEERPGQFFAVLAVAFLTLGLGAGSLPIYEYFENHFVQRLPLAVLATGLCILAILSIFTGLVLGTVTRGRREMKRLAYLAIDSRPRSP